MTTLKTDYANIDEMLKALEIGREQIATIEVAVDAGASGRFIAQDDNPGHGVIIWEGGAAGQQAVGTRYLKKGDKVVWFDPSLPQT